MCIHLNKGNRMNKVIEGLEEKPTIIQLWAFVIRDNLYCVKYQTLWMVSILYFKSNRSASKCQ